MAKTLIVCYIQASMESIQCCLIVSNAFALLADAEMGENEEVAEGEEPMDGEDDELEEGDENEKKYVKKEYVAQPYNSEYLEKTIEEVEALSIKNSR